MRGWVTVLVLGSLTLSPFTLVRAHAADGAPNACGCYREEKGACRCTKSAKCGCPGDCEPANCEAKRQEQAERDNKAALKRIAERDRKAAAEAKKQARLGNAPGKGKRAKNRGGNDDAPEADRPHGEIDGVLNGKKAR